MKRFTGFNVFFALLLCLSFALNARAQAKTWGYNDDGAMGIGGDGYNFTIQPNPRTVMTGASITGISSGGSFSTFLASDGTVLASGGNMFGQLGNGLCESRPRRFPEPVVNLTDVIQVSAGQSHAVAVKSDGTVWTWGEKDLMGNGGVSDGNRCSPVPLPVARLNDVAQVVAGYFHSLALKSDGTVWAWGYNNSGNLGDGTRIYRSRPIQVGVGVAGFEDIISIRAGYYYSMALKSDGTVWEWGGGENRPVKNPFLSNITQIGSASWHKVAVRRDATAWVWGSNSAGQYGNGTESCCFFPYAPPAQSRISNIIDVRGGETHTIALKSDGTVWAWGDNFWGQLGNGMTRDYPNDTLPLQSLVGAGNVLIDARWHRGFAARPTMTTYAGSNVFHYGEKVVIYFTSVTASGTTFYTTIDPASLRLSLPKGLVVAQNQPAYSIVSSAQTSGDVEVCMKVNEFDRERFDSLRLLHSEGFGLVDRTSRSSFIRRQICARVDSISTFGANPLSAFVVARPATAASSAKISGRVLDAYNIYISGASVSLTDSNGETRSTTANPFGFYEFEGVATDETYTLEVSARQYETSTQKLTLEEDLPDINVGLAVVRLY